MSEDYGEIPLNVLQLLKHYVETVEEQKKSLWVDVSTYIQPNEITIRTLTKEALYISFINETGACGSSTKERSCRENIITFSKFLPLFAVISKDLSNQVELLDEIQIFFCSETAKDLPIFSQLVKGLYEFEILTSGTILEWYEHNLETKKTTKEGISSHCSQTNATILLELKPFLEWLESPADDLDDE